MDILVDITHPAHIHFFRNAINIWRTRGDCVTVTSHDKDIVSELLDLYGIEHIRLGRSGKGIFGLGVELLSRDFRLAKVVLKKKPDILVAIGGVYIAHAGWLTRVPRIVFTDTENASLSNTLTFPFATAVITPSCYNSKVPTIKHFSYHGYHELAYTHPNRFVPDPDVLNAFGLKPEDRFVVMRLVSWGAAHDISDSGFTDIVSTVQKLRGFGEVLISSEAELPSEIQQYQIRKNLHLVHHLLYYARLFIGESATMASESATLGTPAIFVSTSRRGYTDELEERYGLCFTFSDTFRQEKALARAVELLADDGVNHDWADKRARLLSEKIDVTGYIVDIVDRFAR